MATTTTRPTPATLLDDELLARCDERAPGYDHDNRFFA